MTDTIRRELIVLREAVRIITEALDRIERGSADSNTHTTEAVYDAWADKLAEPDGPFRKNINSVFMALKEGRSKQAEAFLTNALDVIGERAS